MGSFDIRTLFTQNASNRRWWRDPLFILTLVPYTLALIGLSFTPGSLWSALLLGIGIVLLSGMVLVVTRGQMPASLDIVRPRAELGTALIWYGLILLLAAFTNARGIELVNQFTNWFFLVIAPVGLLTLTRRHGLAWRATLRSAGFTRQQLTTALKLALWVGGLLVPVLYFLGERQRAAIQMAFKDPSGAALAFSASFLLAVTTVGFVEELFFRGLLQSRLAACLGSEWRGVLGASLLFGLFHLPMYFFSPFEPTQGNLVWALASVITEQAIVGVLLGVLWARTHNLVAPVLVHAFIDAMAMMTVLRIGT